MKPAFSCLTILCLACLVPTARADVLELKNGTVLNGKYMGGTTTIIRFETAAGIQAIETSQAIAVTFTTPAAATAGALMRGQTITIPPGALLEFNLLQAVTIPLTQ